MAKQDTRHVIRLLDQALGEVKNNCPKQRNGRPYDMESTVTDLLTAVKRCVIKEGMRRRRIFEIRALIIDKGGF